MFFVEWPEGVHKRKTMQEIKGSFRMLRDKADSNWTTFHAGNDKLLLSFK